MPKPTLPNIVDNLLDAIARHRFNVNQIAKWHGQYDVAGGHLADGAIIVAEQLRLDTLLAACAISDSHLHTAVAAFSEARLAAKLRSPTTPPP